MFIGQLEHLGTTPGLAEESCGECTKAQKIMGWFCGRFDVPLRSNHRGPVRCFDCRRGRNIDKDND